MTTVCVLLATRDERPYLAALLPRLAAEGLDVAVIDHGSSDGTAELLATHRGAPVVAVERLPWFGVFSLDQQLAAKVALADKLRHRWLVHQAPDELLEHRLTGRGLRAVVEEAEAAGHDIVNFEEFVFLPDLGDDGSDGGYRARFLRYYHFVPTPNRLHRVLRRELFATVVPHAGHRSTATAAVVAPASHVLRHYPVLSDTHALRKYPTRRFGTVELKRGWHYNRVGIEPKRLALPPDDDPRLSRLAHEDEPLRRDRPTCQHYWEWE